jgi:hypothetical protein
MNTQTLTPAQSDALAALVARELDTLEAGMARWSCGPEEALAKLIALRADRNTRRA